MSLDPGYPFVVAVAAPRGWSHPGLARAVEERLVGLTVRVRRRQGVNVFGVVGERVFEAAAAAAGRHGWGVSFVPIPAGREWHTAAARAHAQLAASADALVVFSGAEPDEDLVRLVVLCRWLGTAARTVRVEAGAAAGR